MQFACLPVGRVRAQAADIPSHCADLCILLFFFFHALTLFFFLCCLFQRLTTFKGKFFKRTSPKIGTVYLSLKDVLLFQELLPLIKIRPNLSESLTPAWPL